jgi:hypothetical protein
MKFRNTFFALALLGLILAGGKTASALTINLSFDPDSTYTAAGVTDVAAMKAACTNAANQLTSRYSDPINVNIKVTASAGTSDFGSSTAFLNSVSSYNNLRAAFAADSKTADDATTVGNGGSLPAGADPIATTHMYLVARAQAKALGLLADDMQNDGTFNFGGGQPWTYDPNNRKVAGKFDFIGVAVHEFTEIMGRTSLMGDMLGTGTPNYVAFDLFHYTGAGTRGLNSGPGRSFSFDNGTSLLIAFNDGGNGGDLQDWAGPAPDPFNAFGPPNEQDDLTPVDLQTMDVIGYDRITGPAVLANLSTRLPVGINDNALFAGFTVTGNVNKKIIIRAIGPSLTASGAPLPGRLADPILELHDSTPNSPPLETNDNWGDSPNKQAIIDSTVAPTNSLESAIIRSVPPGAYTAIERGVNNGTGIGVVEMYDLDTAADAKLVNISTRGLVQTGNDVLFAGMAVVGGGSQKVIVRALGPSLTVTGKMSDPIMELHDGSGTLLETNDNWVDSPNKQAIIDSTVAPPNNLESAIVRTLTAGTYTAIVRGVNNGTGIGVVEVYALN